MSVEAADEWGSGPGSIRGTRWPRRRNSRAAEAPKAPAPTTITACVEPCSTAGLLRCNGASFSRCCAAENPDPGLQRAVAVIGSRPSQPFLAQGGCDLLLHQQGQAGGGPAVQTGQVGQRRRRQDL